MFSVHKPLYYIVTGKYIFEGVPYLGIEDFTGTSNCGKFFDFSDQGQKEQYEKYQIGDIVKNAHLYGSPEIVEMTPEILDEALSAENAYAYHFLKEEYRQDPEILRRVLLTYKPNLPSYLPKRSSMSK